MSEPHDPPFEELLDYLRRNRGFDFTGYKRSTVMRRVGRRLQDLHLATYPDYVDYLEVHPEEFVQLFNTILINVTSFFRDEAAWEYLAAEIIPKLVAGKSRQEPIRVWSAGCASGEEAYSLALLLAEALGPEAFARRVKIYATDVDEEALAQARLASYAAKDLAPVQEEWRAKYFDQVGERYVFKPHLRRSVIFGRHDLVQDAPMSRLDLLVCRNTLMYFNAETQARILDRFQFALTDGAYLFLGKAEMMATRGEAFRPVELKFRIFVKTPGVPRRAPFAPAEATTGAAEPELLARLRERGWETGLVAQMMVDADGLVALANERMRAMFGLSTRDLGRPLQDLEISYRPLELRSLIEKAYARRQTVNSPEVARPLEDQTSQWLEVHATPLHANGDAPLGVSLTFVDVSQQHRLAEEVQRHRQELETASEELQSTNEELETTNEELQSTNEELETTNEELQSTNEELETMNEELQSTNEELRATNDEMRLRTADLNLANAFLESILGSLRAGVVVVDRQLRVTAWNKQAEEMWGLRAEEVYGQPLLDLDFGLPVEQLPLTAILAGKQDRVEINLPATNRRGKAIQCHVTCTPFRGPEGERHGVVLLLEEGESAS
jgi:two-component system CheB/CheR fusion protein